MFKAIASYFKTGENKPVFSTDPAEIKKSYEPKRWSVFISLTLGYGFFYICRLSFSVVKKVMLNDGVLDAKQIGLMGSAFFITYAVGRFLNGFIADRMNIKKFVSLGLLLSAAVHLSLGYMHGFTLFVILWGINGWAQSMGAAPAVSSLSQWFSSRELGTRYGLWITSHNLGAAMTYMGTAVLVTHYGWRWGFKGPGLVCLLAAVALYYFMYDRPQTYGLPPVADYRNDPFKPCQKENIWKLQLEVIKNPAVWVIGLASAFMYVTRYAIESWGVVYLTEQKAYTTVVASALVSNGQLWGLIASALCGWVSDKFFNSRRSVPALAMGILYAVGITGLIYTPKGHLWLDAMWLSFFGFALGLLLAYLGGLMAVDFCSKRAAGAANGMIGLFSYIGASLQDYVSGYLINAHKTVVDGKTIYDFGPASKVWIGAAVVSLILPLFVWRTKHKG